MKKVALKASFTETLVPPFDFCSALRFIGVSAGTFCLADLLSTRGDARNCLPRWRSREGKASWEEERGLIWNKSWASHGCETWGKSSHLESGVSTRNPPEAARLTLNICFCVRRRSWCLEPGRLPRNILPSSPSQTGPPAGG